MVAIPKVAIFVKSVALDGIEKKISHITKQKSIPMPLSP